MSRQAFTICICPDSQLLRDRLDALLAAPAGDQSASAAPADAARPAAGAPVSDASPAWQRLVFWADEGLTAPFWENLTLQGLFAVPKALVLRNAQALPADSLKRLSAVLAAMAGSPGLVWPLICFEVAFDKGKAKIPVHIPRLPFWQTAEQKGWIEEIPGLTPQTMPAYVRAAAARHSIAASPREIQELARMLPPDAALVNSELAKLSLSVDDKGRLPAEALSLAEHGRDVGLFELMRILQQGGDAPAAWQRILEDRLSGENMVFACVAILLREARTLWQILAGQEPWLPPQAAAQKKAAARQLGFAGVARLWELALMADKGIKTGERGPDQALEILAADLFRLFRNG